MGSNSKFRMLIYLAKYCAFKEIFYTFAVMRSKLFEEKTETAKTSAERWVRIFPNRGDGYLLYDALQEQSIGRLLFDPDGNWIYDGSVLSIGEQEELAGAIGGHQREMDNLFKSL